jgi:hypothetical protein
MIKFALICENRHSFESWFQSGSAFDAQTKAGLIQCPVCQVSRVSKAIMAPAIATRRSHEQVQEPVRAIPQVEKPSKMTLLDERDRELRAAIQQVRQRIFDVAEDVGANFPDEARKIHDGLIRERPIHGQASVEEAKALIEEGISILPIPVLPDEQN